MRKTLIHLLMKKHNNTIQPTQKISTAEFSRSANLIHIDRITRDLKEVASMAAKVDTVLREALALSYDERAVLAGSLLESLEPASDVDVDKAWRKEVARRIAQLDSGEVQTIPWTSVRDQLWDRLNDRNRS